MARPLSRARSPRVLACRRNRRAGQCQRSHVFAYRMVISDVLELLGPKDLFKGRGAAMTQNWRALLGPFGAWRPVSMVKPELASELEELGYGALWLGGS